MMFSVLMVLLAYVIGSIPSGYILARTIRGIDIREHGSGNIGATNVFRVLGKRAGISVFILDVLKGLIAVTLLPVLLERLSPGIMQENGYLNILLGAAAIGGHIWTVFLNFKGGKGVATTAGVVTGLAPGILLTAFIIWLIVFLIWRYVSLASICAAVALPILAVLAGKRVDFVVFFGAVSVIGVYAHRANIKRLIQGTENSFVKAPKSQK